MMDNIILAIADDIVTLRDEANIHLVDFSRTIISEYCFNWLENVIISDKCSFVIH